jgi:hypothetical protein
VWRWHTMTSSRGKADPLPITPTSDSRLPECSLTSTCFQERSHSGESCTCPSCEQPLINLDDGCGVCGWVRSHFLEDKYVDTEISSRNSSTSNDFLEDKREAEISSRKTRRRKGDGSGCIYWRTVTKKGKDYHEAYYQYEFWSSGDRLVKSTKYIPKRLLAQVQQLNDEKAPVREILKLLRVIS